MSTPGLTSQAEQRKQALENLIHSPGLSIFVRQMQAVLKAERAKRQHFYDEVSAHQKAEFINGEIIVPSPSKFCHIDAVYNLVSLLGAYVREHHLGYVGHEKLLISLTRNDYEPDICYFKPEKARRFSREQMKFPVPDFIAEVLSPSTEAIDRGIKFEDYALHGVTEYWLVDPDQRRVEKYLLKGEIFESAGEFSQGSLQITTIPGFEIPVQAIFDPAEQRTALRRILGA